MATIANRRSVMTLFSVGSDPHSHRVRLVLAEKDIAVEVENVEAGQMPEDLLHLNPYSSVPTLVDRELVLYDSRVISEYLDERFPHPPLMPVDPVSRARSRLTLYRLEKDWYSLTPALQGTERKAYNEARKLLRERLLSSVDVFQAKPYFLSDEYSLIDATILPILWRLEEYEISLPKQAKPLLDYAERMFARDSFQLSLSEAEREMR